MLTARYVMIGGFFGAGKTTAILRIAQHLQAADVRVGLITNDQSTGLVDTTMLGAHGFATEEITGGCFCCKFNSLVEASEKLRTDVCPDVFIAEPVGSCTDLKATVSYPLRRMYGEDYSIAPLSVMVDPVRSLRVLGIETGKNFSPKVRYIYEKQLEEADIIVINKCDLVDDRRLDKLQQTLEQRFPNTSVMRTVAREDQGIAEWIQRINAGDLEFVPTMDVDYDVYAEGEALLGWLNASLRVEGGAPFDGNTLLALLAGQIRAQVEGLGGEIAHLKMTLVPQTGNDLAVANLVRNDSAAELSHRLAEPLPVGQLILNLRAECDPQKLESLVCQVLREVCGSHTLNVSIEHIEAFRPGRPTPTHRLAGT